MSLSISDCNFITFLIVITSFVVGGVMSTSWTPSLDEELVPHTSHFPLAESATESQFSFVSLVQGCLCWSKVPHKGHVSFQGLTGHFGYRGHIPLPQLGTTLKSHPSFRTFHEVNLGLNLSSTFPFAQPYFFYLPFFGTSWSQVYAFMNILC